MSESSMLALDLLREMERTVERLTQLSDAELDHSTSHTCAMDGGLRRLLVHNAEHDRMHAGAISTARWTARKMQESELGRLVRELLRERAELVGQLLAMDDDLLDARGQNDTWTVREHVKHVLRWERDSMETVWLELRGKLQGDGDA